MSKQSFDLPLDEGREVRLKFIEVSQPIGIFYIASISYRDLIDISYVDTRRIREEESNDHEIDTLLGIQRRLSGTRETALKQYVNTYDACFPTSVILSIPESCVTIDEATGELVLSSYVDEEEPENNIPFSEIASVLDGQHRIAGLQGYKNENQRFDINVSIFLELDSATEAYIFSVVNQAQTKVNKSLVYDLYSLATSRSPQRLCHQIAVTMNDEDGSPFRNKIKRLGSALQSNEKVAITQAAFVEAMLKHISHPHALAVQDRDRYMKGKKPKFEEKQLKRMVFRQMMIEEQDAPLTAIIWNYFSAIRERWPIAWASTDQGIMLSKTNGFMAFMRFLKDIYLNKNRLNEVVRKEEFLSILKSIDMDDKDFNVGNYQPGSSGEGQLYRDLKEKSGISG